MFPFLLFFVSARSLSLIFDYHLTFCNQVSAVTRACFCHMRDLSRIRPILDFDIAPTVGISTVHSRLDYTATQYHKLYSAISVSYVTQLSIIILWSRTGCSLVSWGLPFSSQNLPLFRVFSSIAFSLFTDGLHGILTSGVWKSLAFEVLTSVQQFTGRIGRTIGTTYVR